MNFSASAFVILQEMMTYSDTHTYTHSLISHPELVYCTFLKVLPMCQLPMPDTEIQ